VYDSCSGAGRVVQLAAVGAVVTFLNGLTSGRSVRRQPAELQTGGGDGDDEGSGWVAGRELPLVATSPKAWCSGWGKVGDEAAVSYGILGCCPRDEHAGIERSFVECVGESDWALVEFEADSPVVAFRPVVCGHDAGTVGH
jgi:hypothetical protein